LVKRALGVGYGGGARLIDFMAEDGIVGPYNGSQAREVLISVEEWESLYKGATVTPKQPTPAAKSKRGPIKPARVEEPEDEAESEDYEVDEEDSDEVSAEQDSDSEDEVDAFAEADEDGDDWDTPEAESEDDTKARQAGKNLRNRTA